MCNLLVPIRSVGASVMVCIGGEGGSGGGGYTMLNLVGNLTTIVACATMSDITTCSKQQQLSEVLLCAG